MEFLRFQTWWTAFEKLAAQVFGLPLCLHWRQKSLMRILHAEARSGNLAVQSSFAKSTLGLPLLTELRKTFEHPIVNAATSIEKLVGGVEEILRGEGVLTVIQSLNAQKNPCQTAPKLLRDHIDNSCSKQHRFASDLMSSISWWKKLKHNATPWQDSSKSMLERKLQEISYWNRSLYDILPHNVRDSVPSSRHILEIYWSIL
jgi:hypothetical protein